jgi:hypothetical protein
MAGMAESAITPSPWLGWLNREANDVMERMARLLASRLGQWRSGGGALGGAAALPVSA